MKARTLAGLLAFLALGACTLPMAPTVPRDPNSPSARMDADRADGQRYNHPTYVPAKGVINKGETSGRKDGDTYVCADKDCKTARKTD